MNELIGHGAQAKVYKVKEGEGYVVVKERLPKKYRHPKLDERINASRVRSEAKILQKVLKNGINVPKVLKVVREENKIIMEYLEGPKLKDYLIDRQDRVEEILVSLGLIVKKLHDLNVIHGDLTTSNMIMKDEQIYLIDFGLGALTATVQDKAVDLYLLQKAFVATHPNLEGSFSTFLKTYGQKSVLDRLEQVRQRGRKKVAFG